MSDQHAEGSNAHADPHPASDDEDQNRDQEMEGVGECGLSLFFPPLLFLMSQALDILTCLPPPLSLSVFWIPPALRELQS